MDWTPIVFIGEKGFSAAEPLHIKSLSAILYIDSAFFEKF
jgi:hypothetical protein